MLHSNVEEALAKWVAANAVPSDKTPPTERSIPAVMMTIPWPRATAGEREGIGAKRAYLVPADHARLQGRIREEEGEGQDPSREGTDIAPAGAGHRFGEGPWGLTFLETRVAFR